MLCMLSYFMTIIIRDRCLKIACYCFYTGRQGRKVTKYISKYTKGTAASLFQSNNKIDTVQAQENIILHHSGRNRTTLILPCVQYDLRNYCDIIVSKFSFKHCQRTGVCFRKSVMLES